MCAPTHCSFVQTGFYACGNGQFGSASLAYSADGSHWSALSFPNDPYPSFRFLAFNSAQGIYVATEFQSNVIAISDNDLASIQKVTLPTGVYSECLCVGNTPVIVIPSTLRSRPVTAIVSGGGNLVSVHPASTGNPIQQYVVFFF